MDQIVHWLLYWAVGEANKWCSFLMYLECVTSLNSLPLHITWNHNELLRSYYCVYTKFTLESCKRCPCKQWSVWWGGADYIAKKILEGSLFYGFLALVYMSKTLVSLVWENNDATSTFTSVTVKLSDYWTCYLNFIFISDTRHDIGSYHCLVCL